MTKAENEKKGNLTVTLNYIDYAQFLKSTIYHFECAVHFLKKQQDLLEIAAIKKGIIDRERRKNSEDRRKGNDRRKLADAVSI